MRTTIVLDDDLLREAKHRAVSLGITLSELVGRAVRDALRGPSGRAEPGFAMVTYGPEGARVHHEPADLSAALDGEDRAALEDR